MDNVHAPCEVEVDPPREPSPVAVVFNFAGAVVRASSCVRVRFQRLSPQTPILG